MDGHFPSGQGHISHHRLEVRLARARQPRAAFTAEIAQESRRDGRHAQALHLLRRHAA